MNPRWKATPPRRECPPSKRSNLARGELQDGPGNHSTIRAPPPPWTSRSWDQDLLASGPGGQKASRARLAGAGARPPPLLRPRAGEEAQAAAFPRLRRLRAHTRLGAWLDLRGCRGRWTGEGVPLHADALSRTSVLAFGGNGNAERRRGGHLPPLAASRLAIVARGFSRANPPGHSPGSRARRK